jgi:hypothetical protein
MMGDSWSADVIGAAAAEIRCLWLNRHSLTCPDASLAVEIQAFEPLGVIAQNLWQNEGGVPEARTGTPF